MPTNKKKFNFKLGADPEFVLTMQGRKVDAKQTMELILAKKPGFTKSRDGIGYDIEPFGNIGWDGASSTAEMRPKPSNDPQEITNNIGGIFKGFTKHIKICDMSVISEYSPVGGHIHLEVPKGERWSTEKRSQIHKRLASFYFPILIAENKVNLNLRIKQGYGSLRDYRMEEKFKYEDGTPGWTFEFRCPSAEWLATPKITNATLAYMGVIYHEILNHPKNFAKYSDIIYKSDKQGEALQTLAIMEFSLLTESMLNKIKKYVRKFEMYDSYKQEIEYIFNPKQVMKDKQKANYNIAVGWNLVGNSIPKKSEILASKKKIKNIAQVKDFDMLKNVMNVHYNDDKNVGIFAEALKDRIAAFNWKLKNNYFIFGMRKGIEKIISKNLRDDYLTGREIIKTTSDMDEVEKLFNKMNQKFNSNNGIIGKATLDFGTGKIKDMRENIIMIGIPYNMRVEEDIKEFLNFIWILESGEITKKNNKKHAELIDDSHLTVANRGNLYKILTKQTESKKDEIVIDNSSTSLRRSEEAIAGMIDEMVAQRSN